MNKNTKLILTQELLIAVQQIKGDQEIKELINLGADYTVENNYVIKLLLIDGRLELAKELLNLGANKKAYDEGLKLYCSGLTWGSVKFNNPTISSLQ